MVLGAPWPRLPGTSARFGDGLWSALIAVFGGAILALAGLITLAVFRIAAGAFPPLAVWDFLTKSDWDPVAGSFGAVPFLYGTLVTSAIALALAVPVAVGTAVFLSEMAPRRVKPAVSFAIETLAAIPSVVYGLWGLFVIVPLLRDDLEPVLKSTVGFLPLFQGPSVGLGYLAAGVVLAVMVLPTIASVTYEVLKATPEGLREAALALGATRWETVRVSVLPVARTGVVGAAMLGLGRALGETMAVTMLIGNSPEIHASLFAAGYSLPAVIANEFAEASGAVHTGALAALGLVLLGVTVLLNGSARLLLKLARRRSGARA
jgi:phosphate transport system permease protein